jgi:LacI family transcriptional regulator
MGSNIIAVAKKAGVSIATVSRVINKKGIVKPETRDRVLAVAHKMKYTPNPAARGLIMRRTEAIGLLLPDLHGEFFSEVIRGADAAVQAQGHHLIVSSSHNDSKEIEAALRFMRGRVDGLVVMSPQIDSEILLATLPKDLPVILLNCRTHNPLYDTITTDGFGGAKDMVSYLLSLGHRKIAIIKGSTTNSESHERLNGYLAAYTAYTLMPDPAMQLDGEFTEESAFNAVRQVLRGTNRPTAIFASNDSMAIGAIGAIREAGLRIPHDISVCGFDDIPVAKYLSPSLTTVHVPIHDLGTMAINRIFDRLHKKTKGAVTHVFVPTTLSIRNSCRKINPMSNQEKEGNAA